MPTIFITYFLLVINPDPLKLAYSHFWENNTDSVIYYCNKAQDFYSNTTELQKLLEAINLKAHALIQNNNIYSAKYELENAIKYLSHNERFIDIETITVTNYSNLLSRMGHNILAYTICDRFIQQNQYIQKSPSNYLNLLQRVIVALTWMQDNSHAISYIHQLNELSSLHELESHESVENNLILGTYYYHQNSPKLALQYFNTAHSIIIRDKLDANYRSESLRGLVLCHLKDQNYQNALNLVSEMDSLSPLTTQYHIGMTELIKSKIHIALKEPNIALRYSKASVANLDSFYGTYKNHKSSESRLTLSNVLISLDLHDNAKQVLDTALIALKKTPNSITNKPLAINILKSLFTVSNRLSLIMKSIFLLHDIRTDIRSLDSKLESSVKSREVYNLAIPAALDKYIQTDSIKYFELALYWSDLSKGGVLSEQIARERMIRRYNNDSLYRYYVKLTSDIHALRKQIIDQEHNNSSSTSISKAEKLLLEKRQQLKNIEDSTEFVHKIIPLDTFMSNVLQSRCGLLQSYVSDSNYYLFFYAPNSPPWHNVVPRDELDELLGRQIKLQRSTNLNFSAYSQNSHELYQLLFPSNVNWESHSHLIIVPDGELHELSFESLLVEKANKLSPKSWKFLFHEVPISYSLGLHLNQSFDQDNKKKNVLAFAPSFDSKLVSDSRDCANEIFGSLNCTIKEVNYISDSWQIESYINADATTRNFKNNLTNQDIIHLATHACIDTTNYYKSAIVFNDKQLEMNEIYDMDWNGKTVVLSACNTAQGKNISGEGVFNFARTLTELGCREVMVSLWPIDDCSTAELIGHFYRHLKNGLSTPQALRAARTSFIHKADKLQSLPAFWAPLILISNDQNITTAQAGWPIPATVLWAAILIMVFGMFLILRWKANQPSA
ncbi:MAG: CHAT domain-containing protein [Saprospiraceae bacterium]|nr:CHAT domain-containing protein [Saprospiraceae bacterium]